MAQTGVEVGDSVEKDSGVGRREGGKAGRKVRDTAGGWGNSACQFCEVLRLVP